jgi:polyisoprenyl-teichoic acid--peptidoglycan teichoic acid transferase
MTSKYLLLMYIAAVITTVVLTPRIISALYRPSLVSPLPGQTDPHTSEPTPTEDPKRPLNILLMGYGGGTHEGGFLTDTMLLARIAPRAKKIWLISIPRDLWVSLPIGSQSQTSVKINNAFAIGFDNRRYPDKPSQFSGEDGGGKLAKYAIETVTGLPVDYYAAFSFSGFIKSVNALGGIDVKVKQALSDPYFPIAGKEDETCEIPEAEIEQMSATASGFELEKFFPCRFESLQVEPGEQHMDGETALKYVRSRHASEGGGDFNRSSRQKEIIRAMMDKIFAVNFIPKAFPFLSSWKGEIQTDLPLTKVPRLTGVLSDIQSYAITNVSLTTPVLTESRSPDGQYILVPHNGNDDWKSIREYLEKQME